MSNKKIKKTGLFLLLLISVLSYSYFFRLPFVSANVFEAVPNNTSFFIKIEANSTITSDWKSLDYFQEWLKWEPSKSINADWQEIDSLFQYANLYNNIPQKARTIVALMKKNRTSLGRLFLLDDYSQDFVIESFIKKLSEQASIKTSSYNFKGTLLYDIRTKNNKWTLATYKGVIAISRTSIFTEEAINQLQKISSNVCRSSDFKKVHKKVEEASCALYFNVNNIGTELAGSLNPIKANDLHFFSEKILNWGAIAPRLHDDKIELEAAFSSHSNVLFENLANSSTSSNIQTLLTNNVSVASCFVHNEKVPFIKKSLSQQNEKYWLPWLGNDWSYAIVAPYDIEYEAEKVLIVGVKDAEMAEENLLALSKIQSNNQPIAYQNYKLFDLDLADIIETGLSNKLRFPKKVYGVVLEHGVIFCASANTLKKWIDKYNSGLTLERSEEYLQLIGESKHNSIQIYMKIDALLQILKSYLSDDLQDDFVKQYKGFSNISAIQLNVKKDGVLAAKGNALLGNSTTNNVSIAWKLDLETPAITAPLLVTNPETQTNYIWIQDEEYTLYCVSKQGDILWDIGLESAIQAPINIIDYYKNNEWRVLFNTKKKIHLMDYDGKELSGFPRRISPDATTSMLCVDYNDDKFYEFFVCSSNNNIYGYEKNGKPLDDWKPKVNVGEMHLPIQYCYVNARNYLMSLSSSGNLFAFQPNGKAAFDGISLNGSYDSKCSFSFDFSVPPHRILTIDKSGTANEILFDRKAAKRQLKIGANKNVKSAIDDIMGNKRQDFILLENKTLKTFYYEGKKLLDGFSYSFEEYQDDVFTTNIQSYDKKLVATYSKKAQQIYLLNNKGKLIDGFPLAGTTPFIIIDLFKEQKNVLLVANKKEVYAYKIEL